MQVTTRLGAPALCPSDKKLTNYLPGLGGDSVILRRGVQAAIFDIGDDENGPSLGKHDRLIITHASPDKFKIEKKGHTLLLCSAEQAYAIAILRQYCSGKGDGKPWNNRIEEITFASGETWLADEIFDELDPAQPYITHAVLSKFKIKGLTDKEIENWRYYRFSEKLPGPRVTRRACRADTRMLKARGYID